MRSGPTRLLLAALVAGATGVASVAGAGAAVEAAGAAGLVGLIGTSSSGGANQLAPWQPGPCIQLGCKVRRELASVTSAPLIACAAAPIVVVAPPRIAIVTAPAPPPVWRAVAVLTFAPKTSPPIA